MESFMLVFNGNIPIKSVVSDSVRIHFISVSEPWNYGMRNHAFTSCLISIRKIITVKH